MKIWEERVRIEIKAAPEQVSLGLRNSLPEYLAKLAEGLSGDRAPQKSAFPRGSNPVIAGTKHGRARAQSHNYTIDQLISEYHILRQTIFEVMEAEMDLSAGERDTIIDSIEQAVNDAATEFSAYLKAVQEDLSNALIHDLRSPLSAAVLLLEMVRSDPENEMHNRKIQKQISASLERVQAMLRHLLDYSSIKAGQGLTLHFEQIDLSKLIRQVTDELNFSGPDRFIVKAPPTLIGFWDVRGMTSILENLATNALKYGDPETPIVISAKNDTSWIQLVVHNHGKPISPEDQANLFQRFRRAKTVKDESGWGLGLTIVKSLAESHGGHVGVESLESSGTSFIVQLPIDCTGNNKMTDTSSGEIRKWS